VPVLIRLTENIKVVIFDIGGVLVPFNESQISARLKKFTSISETEIFYQIFRSPLHYDFLQGKVQPVSFFNQIRSVLKLNLEFDQFKKVYREVWLNQPNRQCIEFMESCQKKAITVGLMSNIDIIGLEYLLSRFAFLNQCTFGVYSCYARSIKPQPEIYRQVEQRSPANAGQMLFIDDSFENIKAAHIRGWQTYHYQKYI